MSAEDLTDLDFTQMLRVRPAAAAPAAPARQPDGRIGRLGPGHAGNHISYARAAVAPPAAVAEAPVVVVEDDEITRQLLAKALTTHGYPVQTAGDARELQQLVRRPPLPRLILLDVELPQVNGFKILALLRQHPQTSAIPLVMLTARTENKDLLHALSLGADGYLSKPVTVAALRAMVDRLLRKAA